MGSLKPGATYIYERADGVTYAREFGSDPSTRKPIGWDLGRGPKDTFLGMPVRRVGELVAIAQAAETNSSLHEALERVKILYYLSKEYGDSKT